MNNSDLELGTVLDANGYAPAEESKLAAGCCISDRVMDIGRDEMNLAEFPLGGLASRTPKGVNSLVFEDRVWDKRQKVWVRKKLTVAASTEFGLPTAADDEVILGLLQLTHAGRFVDRKLTFVPAELFRILGWREEGRSYSRLEASLKRWIGVTLHYDHAWWDKKVKTWMDEHFHLLDNAVIPRGRKKTGKVRQQRKRLPWTITWNEVVFKSFQGGYLKRIDMSVFRELKSTAAKRMYRFLDKRFHFTNHLKFDLRVFACERIGFNRKDDNSQLKRRLDRAIGELEAVGFLRPLPPKHRYRQIRRGQWEIVFSRMPKQKLRQSRTAQTLESILSARGVRDSAAAKLVREHSPEQIRQAVREYDALMNCGTAPSLNNPPGLLISWIKRGRDIPCECSPPKAEPTLSTPMTSEQAEDETQRETIREYLDGLSAKERNSIETEAMQEADSFLVNCYERAKAEGDVRFANKYRDMIVESHARRLSQPLDACTE
jgi:hypothetical protein